MLNFTLRLAGMAMILCSVPFVVFSAEPQHCGIQDVVNAPDGVAIYFANSERIHVHSPKPGVPDRTLDIAGAKARPVMPVPESPDAEKSFLNAAGITPTNHFGSIGPAAPASRGVPPVQAGNPGALENHFLAHIGDDIAVLTRMSAHYMCSIEIVLQNGGIGAMAAGINTSPGYGHSTSQNFIPAK